MYNEFEHLNTKNNSIYNEFEHLDAKTTVFTMNLNI